MTEIPGSSVYLAARPKRHFDLLVGAKPDRLINVGRFLTSSFALLAVYLDPTRPSVDVEQTYTILVVYVLISLWLLLVPLRKSHDHVLHIIPTAIDIITLGILAHYSEELESPYFVFFTFTLISATIRWRWRGVLATALALQVLLLIVGIPDLEDGGEPALNVLILRSAYCWVATLMLGYFGSYRSRSELRLKELASWPHEIIPEENRPWLSASLQHASHVLGTSRIMILWQDQDRRLAQLACWTGTACEFADGVDIAPQFSPLLDGASTRLAPESFQVLLRGIQASLPDALDGVLRQFADHDNQSVNVSGFHSIRYRGSVIVVDPAFQDENIASLTRIVASRIAIELEQFSLVGDLASAASLRERVRFARDLHDSVLQDLTAAVLQLGAASKELPDPARDTLAKIQQLLHAQQRRLRHFVTDAREAKLPNRWLIEQLQAFVEPLGSQWNCKISLCIDPPDLIVTDTIATELCLALSEATANAARHGAAKEVSIAVVSQRDQLHVQIHNDGERCEAYPKPSSLGRRVEDLGGELTVSNDPSGLVLTMNIPMLQLQ